jgi:hypothetical protein
MATSGKLSARQSATVTGLRHAATG